MPDLSIEEFRAFLAGDDTHLQTNKHEWGYFDGRILGDPGWPNRYSEICDGLLLVRSHFRRGKVDQQFALGSIAFVAQVSFHHFLHKSSSVYFWLVDEDRQPFAEVPWGVSVDRQAPWAGLRVRHAKWDLRRKAFKAFRPQLRL